MSKIYDSGDDLIGDCPELSRGFLAINITNNTPEALEFNNDLINNNETGNWLIEEKVISKGLPGKYCLIFFNTKNKNLKELLLGKVNSVREVEDRQRFVISVEEKWDLIGQTEKSFSNFFKSDIFSNFSSNPVCVWLNILDGLKNDTDALEDDLFNILDGQEQDKNTTEKSQLIMGRLGQGDFREKVLEVWGGKCAVTGSDLKEVLRASHIKPWKDSNDEERLNPYNGIPLAATFDALFDRGLISFNDNGDIKISRYLSKKNQKSLGINKEDKVEGGFFEENIPFLEHHRNNIFKK